eukprot:Polyplicarium_translucidae@DN3383_c0_g1_i3.p1
MNIQVVAEGLVSRYLGNAEGQGGTQLHPFNLQGGTQLHPFNLQGGTQPLNLQGGTQLHPLNVLTSSATEQPLDFSQQSTTNVWKGGQGAAGGSCRTPSPTMSAPSPSGVLSSEKAPKQHTDIHREEFECKIRRKVLHTRRSHGEHEKSHTQAVRYRSDGHVRMPRRRKQFECETCHKEYSSRRARAQHMKSHTEEFACRVCKKKFASNATLKQHSITHTGVKPHVCPKCRQRFTTKRSLVAHDSIHTGIKEFRCTFAGCAKAFALKSSLKTHQLVHRGGSVLLPVPNLHLQDCHEREPDPAPTYSQE